MTPIFAALQWEFRRRVRMKKGDPWLDRKIEARLSQHDRDIADLQSRVKQLEGRSPSVKTTVIPLAQPVPYYPIGGSSCPPSR